MEIFPKIFERIIDLRFFYQTVLIENLNFKNCKIGFNKNSFIIIKGSDSTLYQKIRKFPSWPPIDMAAWLDSSL